MADDPSSNSLEVFDGVISTGSKNELESLLARLRTVQSEQGQARVCFAPLPRALATRPEPLQVQSWLARSVAGLSGRRAPLPPGPKP